MTFSIAKKKKVEEAERQQIAALRAYLDSVEEEARIGKFQDGMPSAMSWPRFSFQDAS
jgi:hypothetical protein